MSLDSRYIGLDSGLAQYVPPGGGGLTSVGLTMPPPFLVSNSPLVANGTLGVIAAVQGASTVWAAPIGGGTPVFRLLDAVDIPPLDAAKTASGMFSTARLGIGTANAGTFLRGDSQWAAVPLVLPGGLASHVQYNAGGTFGGSPLFTFNAPTGELALSSPSAVSAMTISATGASTTGLTITRSSGNAPAALITGPAQTNAALMAAEVTTSGVSILAGAAIGDTSGVEFPLVISHDTTAFASVATGYGVGTAFRLRTALSTPIAGEHYVSWLDPAHATMSSMHTWTTVQGGGPLTGRLRLMPDGELRIGTAAVYAGLRAGVSGGSTFTLPTTVGTSGAVLTTDGGGMLSWTTPYADPLTTAGDLLYYDTGTARLPIGSTGNFLRVSITGRPSWQSVVLYSDPLAVDGDILVRIGGVTTRLPIGGNGQVLTVTANLPSWQTGGAGYVDPLTTAGDLLYFDTSTTRLPIGSTGAFLRVSMTGRPLWQSVALYSDPLTTDGDLLVRIGGATTRLPIGINGQALTVASNLPSWITPYVDPLVANGDLLMRSAGVTTRLPLGSPGQFLRASAGLPTWQTVALYVNPLAADGDLVYFNTTTTRLPVGSSGQILRVVGGLPAWQTIIVYVDPLSTTGDMVVRSGGVTTRLAVGSSGQILTVAGGLPTWQTPAAAYVDPMTTIGDLVYRNGSNVTARLAAGTNGQLFRMVGSVPGWQSVTIYSDPLTTNGDIVIRSGGVTTRLPIGSNGQILTVVTSLPVWQTPAAVYIDPMTTVGDLVYRNGSNVTSRLAAGTNGQLFSMVGSVPGWQTVPIYVDPLLNDGDLLVRAGGVTTRLPIGTNGQILTVVSGAIAWQ